MKLVRYREPGSIAQRGFNNWMEDLFSEFFDSSVDRFSGSGIYPKVDIEENEKDYLFKVEVPGVKKEDVNVEVDDRVLTISGEKKEVVEEKEKNVFRKETYSGTFSRSFTLPEHVTSNQAEAKYEDGILYLKIPKSKEKIKKKIAIK